MGASCAGLDDPAETNFSLVAAGVSPALWKGITVQLYLLADVLRK
jgi:hypothetical protein